MSDADKAQPSPDLSVVVLAYNEEANVPVVMDEILGELKSLDVTWEIVFVDDGSRDGTGRVADELAKTESRVRVVHHPTNLGLGGGYRTGFREARGTYMTYFPADGQFPASIIAQFLREIPSLDMVLGFLPDRRSELLARALSAAERILYWMLFLGKMPKFQGIVMFRRALLDDIPLVSAGPGWGVIMEFILRVASGGYRVKSVPTPWRPRLSGVSKAVSTKNIRANLEQLLAIRRALGKKR